MRHALSFDVECFHQYNLRDFLGRSQAPTREVERNVHWILDRLAERSVHATFFVLGNVARSFPGLVRRMVHEGHEVGVHGHDHVYLDQLDAGSFRDELMRAREALDAAGAVQVIGHRAPRFSLSDRTPWAFEVLARTGFVYDSSVVPARGAHGYGDADAPRGITRHASGVYEIPLTSVSVLGRRVPAVGGGYVRYFPFAFTAWALSSRERESLAAVAYFHPYEFDLEPAWPRVEARRPLDSLRYLRFCAMQSYGRGPFMRQKLRSLLAQGSFGPMRALLPMEALA